MLDQHNMDIPLERLDEEGGELMFWSLPEVLRSQ